MDWIFDSDKCSALLKKIVNTIFDMSKLEEQLKAKRDGLINEINTLNSQIDDLNKKINYANEDEKEELESELAIRTQELDQKNNELTRVYSELANLQRLIGTLKNDQSKIDEANKNAKEASKRVKNKLGDGTDLLIGTLRLGPGMLKQSAKNIGDAWKNGTWLQTAAETTYNGVKTWIGENIETDWLRDVANCGANIAYGFTSGVITLVFSGDKEGSGTGNADVKEGKNAEKNTNEGWFDNAMEGVKNFFTGGKESITKNSSKESEKSDYTVKISDKDSDEEDKKINPSEESSGTDKAKTNEAQKTQNPENPPTGNGAEKVGGGTQEDGTQGDTKQKKSREYGDTPAELANTILTNKNAYAKIGNGEERKKNLKDAGYTDAEIDKSQEIINKMMDNYKNDNSYRFTLNNAQEEQKKLS